MTTARKQLISIEATSYYHCVSRCVRRSFLCGEDKQNQVSYEHRREWIVNKISIYSICAYVSNHYHLVVNINQTSWRRYQSIKTCTHLIEHEKCIGPEWNLSWYMQLVELPYSVQSE